MRREQLSFLCMLLALLVFGGCGDDEEPMSPSPRLSTEVAVAPDTIPQGIWANGLATFSAVSGEIVEISFNHSVILGYRVTSADGELVMEFPSEEVGSPTDFVVRPDWDMKVTINVPPTRAQAEEPDRFVTWLSEEDVLPVGEYILEAGLYGMEKQYPWSKAKFTVSGTVAGR